MACLLTIETSATICSTTLSVTGKPILELTSSEKKSHAALLGVFVSESFGYARNNRLSINAVAISAGPGSYTGLRIGVSEAKGFCYGLGIPLIAISTLKLIACQALHSMPHINFPLFCPMIDARQMEVYTALYDVNLDELRPAQTKIINGNSFSEYLDKQPIIFAGNGADKCRTVLQSPNALFAEFVTPTATAMIPLAEEAYKQKNFVDVAYFTPSYLKEFQATPAQNKNTRE